MTYIVDQQQNIVKFKVDDRVNAFTAGLYTIQKENSSLSMEDLSLRGSLSRGQSLIEPVLVYVTINSEIWLYYNVTLPSIRATTLIALMKDSVSKYYALKEDQSSLVWTLQEQVSLFHSCLHEDFDSDQIVTYKSLLQSQLEKLMKENVRLEERINKLANSIPTSSASHTDFPENEAIPKND